MVDVSIDEMKMLLQEWYAQALSYEELFEIHYAVRKEADKQAVHMAQIINEDMEKMKGGATDIEWLDQRK